MATEAHNKSITDLLPDTLIELFEVEVGGTVGSKKFHAGKIIDKDIVLRGVTYYCLPIEATGFESKGDGTLPRPKLIISNPDGLITDLIKQEGDMVGNVFKRIRIFLKFIDEVNFPEGVNPFGNSDPDSRFDDDLYIFNRKISENKYFIEFELVSPLEVENYKLPARIMVANYCPWKYRGIGCRYGSRDDYTGPTTNLESKEGGDKMQSIDFFPRREAVQKVTVSNAGSGTAKFITNISDPDYSTGTATQTGFNVVGSGTSWAAEMVGREFTFTGGGGSSGYITAFTDATHMAVSVSNPVSPAEAYTVGGYAIGDHTASPGIAVDALPLALKVADQLVFVNQGVLTLSADAAAGAIVVYGTLTTTALPDNEIASLSYPVGDYSLPDGIRVEQLAQPINFGQTISFGRGVYFTLNADADENADEIFGDLTGGSVGTAAEGAIADSSGFAITDYRVQGVPIADARDKRFDDLNNDFGLTGMRWVYEYNPTVSDIALNAAVSADTVSSSSNALELSVVDVPESINPKRTITLFDSGGSEIGTLKVGALVLKTVTVKLTADADDADTVTANGAATSGATSMTVYGISENISVGRIITFIGGSTFKLTSAASTADTTLNGDLTGDVRTLQTGRINGDISLEPIPVSFKKGEVITFGASQTVTLTEAAGIGAQLLQGTVAASPDPIATGTSGTLRGTIKGALNLTTGISIAADATGKVGYVKGDVVSISSFSDEPTALFVCIKDHTVFQDPRFKKEYWVEDQCSKTLNGCKMRFGEYDHLPFGGFPSIEAYRYTN
jgi:lambda family phage minor tail protein L